MDSAPTPPEHGAMPLRTPLVPLVPILGICSAFYLMIKLPLLTWEVLIILLVIGLVIYFTYSIKHSKVYAMSPAEIREKMFTLQMLLEYDLQDLRSRKEL
jgi:hypothetical protein